MRLPLLALLALPAAAGASVLYHNDFESGVIDQYWGPTAHLDQGAAFSKFMGRYSENTPVLNNAVSLTIPAGGTDTGSGTGTDSYLLTFDFYCIDSWDGNSTTSGPDEFGVRINGVFLWDYTFSNSNNSQSYPYAPTIGPTLLGYNANDKDSIYRQIQIPFSIGTATQIQIKWRSLGLLGMQDESWGIDNVTITQAPTPGSLALLGLGGLTLVRRRRR
jgi:MYXO-CTERM domain-containing protein